MERRGFVVEPARLSALPHQLAQAESPLPFRSIPKRRQTIGGSQEQQTDSRRPAAADPPECGRAFSLQGETPVTLR